MHRDTQRERPAWNAAAAAAIAGAAIVLGAYLIIALTPTASHDRAEMPGVSALPATPPDFIVELRGVDPASGF